MKGREGNIIVLCKEDERGESGSQTAAVALDARTLCERSWKTCSAGGE